MSLQVLHCGSSAGNGAAFSEGLLVPVMTSVHVSLAGRIFLQGHLLQDGSELTMKGNEKCSHYLRSVEVCCQRGALGDLKQLNVSVILSVVLRLMIATADHLLCASTAIRNIHMDLQNRCAHDAEAPVGTPGMTRN